MLVVSHIEVDVRSPAFRRKFVRRHQLPAEAGTTKHPSSFICPSCLCVFVPLWLRPRLSLSDHAAYVSVSSGAQFVILGSDVFIRLAELFDVDLRKLDHAHLDESVLYA